MNPLVAIVKFLDQGGPTLWMLVFCSVLMMAVIFERWYKIRSLVVDHEWLLAQMAYFLQDGNRQRALEFCEQVPGCLPRVFEVGLNRYDRRQEDIESAMGTSISEQMHQMERNLGVIGTLAVIAPFIGLFGTVMGIIRSFEDISKQGASSPAVVSAGVAEALISTAAGLFVAIFSVIAFNYFRGRTRVTQQHMQIASTRLVEMILLSREGKEFPEDLRPPSTR